MDNKRNKRKLRLSAILMIAAIIGVAAFQGYWIGKLYGEGFNNLKREIDIAFRDAMYHLQLQHFRKGTVLFGKGIPDNLFILNVLDGYKDQLLDSLANDSQAADPSALPLDGPIGDSMRKTGHLTISIERRDSLLNGNTVFYKRITAQHGLPVPQGGTLPHIMHYSSGVDTAGMYLSIGAIDSAYRKELLKYKIDLPYTIQRFLGPEKDLEKQDDKSGKLKTGFLVVGLSNAYAYQASFDNPFGYLVGRIKLPLVIALLLLIFTTVAFVFMYRNLLQQQRLAAIKNEFISNMTHELKTPIATVNVAVEALRHFDALDNPVRTREYLDISAIELRRLSMLVDKVLKLSMFENREITLNTGPVDMYELSASVIDAMRLHLDKAGAAISLHRTGTDFTVQADRMHMSSVLSNLLDNALKYSREHPVIAVDLSEEDGFVIIAVSDNGMGIPAAYRDKVFEKFFRVPTGDHHNIKGYGLGLSYVHHIVMRHNGSIRLDSKEGVGSSFIIKLPVT
jgi:two-component system phosphate regulon sensor histidine kinase PhoR